MKSKIILATVLALGTVFAANAEAHGPWHGGYRGGYHGGWGYGGWVAPALIGGVVGYELARPPVYVQQPPVYVQQPPVVVSPNVTTQPINCTAWTQIQNADGTVTTTRTCTQ